MITDADFCFVISGRDRIGQGINKNISPLLEVTSKDDVIALLDDISDSSTKVDKSVIADDMKKLQDNIESTKQKINTVKEAEKE